ncbi:MAG: hypothetical protein MUO68_06325, partial [Desulfobacteraceae bacterium]|nr:hypothetical protein [Desulfobacteraceae bacterium]
PNCQQKIEPYSFEVRNANHDHRDTGRKGREPPYTEKLYRTISPSANVWAMRKAVNDFGWY